MKTESRDIDPAVSLKRTAPLRGSRGRERGGLDLDDRTDIVHDPQAVHLAQFLAAPRAHERVLCEPAGLHDVDDVFVANHGTRVLPPWR